MLIVVLDMLKRWITLRGLQDLIYKENILQEGFYGTGEILSAASDSGKL